MDRDLVTRNHDALTRVLGGGTRSQGRYGKRGGLRPGGYSDAKGSHRPDGRGGGEGMVARTPLGRLGTTSDVADVVAFLASPDARWVTGQVVEASGGINP